jgi:hypothetical protein
MRTIRKAIAGVVLAGAVFASGYLAHPSHTVTKTVVNTTDDVTSFNDGFLTAQSDCK